MWRGAGSLFVANATRKDRYAAFAPVLLLLLFLVSPVSLAEIAPSESSSKHARVIESVETRRLQIPITLEPRGGLSFDEACGDMGPGDIVIRVGDEVLQAVGLDEIEQPVKYVIVINEAPDCSSKRTERTEKTEQWKKDANVFLGSLEQDDAAAVFSFGRKLSIRALKQPGRPISLMPLPTEQLDWGTSVYDALRYSLLATHSSLYHTAVIFISGAYSDTDMIQLDMGRFVSAASRIENLSFYSIISFGVMGGPIGSASLAHQSGGRIFLRESNSIQSALADVEDHLDRYRLLTYVPPQIKFNAGRRIKISSRNDRCQVAGRRTLPRREGCSAATVGEEVCASPIQAIDKAVPELWMEFSGKSAPLILESGVDGSDTAKTTEIDVLALKGTDLFEEYHRNRSPIYNISPWGSFAERELTMLAPAPRFLQANVRSIGELFHFLVALGIKPPDGLEISPLMITGNGYMEHFRFIASTLCKNVPSYHALAEKIRDEAVDHRTQRTAVLLNHETKNAPFELVRQIRESEDSALEEACGLFETEIYAADVWWAHAAQELDHISLLRYRKAHDFNEVAREKRGFAWDRRVWKEFVEWTRPRGHKGDESWAVLGDLIVPLVPAWDPALDRLAFFRIRLRAHHDPLPRGDIYGLGARSLSKSSLTERILNALDLPPAISLVRFLGKEDAVSSILTRFNDARITTTYRLHRTRPKIAVLLNRAVSIEELPRRKDRKKALEVFLTIIKDDEVIWKIHGLGFLVRETSDGSSRKKGDLDALHWVEVRE